MRKPLELTRSASGAEDCRPKFCWVEAAVSGWYRGMQGRRKGDADNVVARGRVPCGFSAAARNSTPLEDVGAD